MINRQGTIILNLMFGVLLSTFVVCTTNQNALAQCETKILASDGVKYDEFGGSVSISGDLAVIGLKGRYPDNHYGAAYIFRMDPYGSEWTEEAKLTASDKAYEDMFGRSVSIFGNVVVIGAAGDDDNGLDSGSAYVFRYNGEEWLEEAKLLASDGKAEDAFGYSVAIYENRIVIGSWTDSDADGLVSGSGYVFKYDGVQWVEETKLITTDRARNDNFGYSVSIYADVAVIGAPLDDTSTGSVYVYRYHHDGSGQWIEEAKLITSDSGPEEWFGNSISISGDVLVIGAYKDTDNGFGSGSAYIFRFNGINWYEETKLLASDGDPWDYFGQSVSISNDVIVIGAHFDEDNGRESGSAYIYHYDPNISDWIEETKLFASDNPTYGLFGNAVSISGDLAVIGAMSDDYNGGNAGSAYIYELSTFIIEQPVDQHVDLDDPVCLSVATERSIGTIKYQWRRNRKNLSDFGTIKGSHTDTLCITKVACADTGYYDVVITDDCGQVTSEPAQLLVEAPPILFVDATCPMGGPMAINWDCATPSSQIAIIFATNQGNFSIPSQFQCAGTQLGLGSNQIQLFYKGYAGSKGSRTIYGSASAAACGGYLQLIDLETCAVSNVVRIE